MAGESKWAADSDCADCGKSDAGFTFQGAESICADCAPQYHSEDICAKDSAPDADR